MTGKRQRMFEIVKEADMTPIMPDGGYFMLVDISGLSKLFSCRLKNIKTIKMNLSFYFFIFVFLFHFLEVDKSGYDDDIPLDKIVQQWLIKEKVRSQ